MLETYLELGLRHILDIKAYDHLLFVVALCAIYRWSDWRKLFIPITAFTIGHSISLALSSLDILRFNPDVIEFLIPATILITVISNIIYEKSGKTPSYQHYLLTLIFGLVHGFGFANYFSAILGAENHITIPLLSFNIGVEIGQLIIVCGLMILTYIVTKIIKIRHAYWNYILSIIVGLISIWLMYKIIN